MQAVCTQAIGSARTVLPRPTRTPSLRLLSVSVGATRRSALDGTGPRNVRVHHLEQVLRKIRVPRVELQLHPRREERRKTRSAARRTGRRTRCRPCRDAPRCAGSASANSAPISRMYCSYAVVILERRVPSALGPAHTIGDGDVAISTSM